MLAYSTEQILFRKDPWEGVTSEGVKELTNEGEELHSQQDDKPSNGAAYTREAEQLTRWMREAKPYLNPEFKLMDLREVLPKNRTYLSQFINDTYGCSFYQFVNRYRIEEAQRLMHEHPDMRLSDVATRSGFKSRESFARTFTQVTGLSPREWIKH